MADIVFKSPRSVCQQIMRQTNDRLVMSKLVADVAEYFCHLCRRDVTRQSPGCSPSWLFPQRLTRAAISSSFV